MAAKKSGYFKTAWADVRGSKGWALRAVLLGLLQLIPIFGQIVFNGYLLGWIRELAWNIKSPMPKGIFENRDGKLYRQGWYALVIYVVFFILVAILICVGLTLVMAKSSATSSAYYMRRNGFSVTPTFVIGIIVLVVAFILAIVATLFSWSGQLRMSVYDRFGAGFQVGKLKNMIRADFGGIMRIFLMCLIMMVISLAIVGLIFFILASINGNFLHISYALVLAGFGGLNTSIARALMIFFAVSVALCFVLYVFTSVANMIIYRALGYWLAQFDVPSWPSMDEDVAFRKFDTKAARGKGARGKAAKGARGKGVRGKAGKGVCDESDGGARDNGESARGEGESARGVRQKTEKGKEQGAGEHLINGEHPTGEQSAAAQAGVVVAGKELADMQRAKVSKAQQVAMVQESELQARVPVQPSDPKSGIIENPAIEVAALEPTFEEGK